MAKSSLVETYGLSLASLVMTSIFAGIAWYACIRVMVNIGTKFKKYKSLYFWSLIVCSFSTFMMPLFFMLKNFQVAGNINALEAFNTLCWYGMVTGQAVVLYSRLHLVVVDRRRVKWVLYMIIVNFFILHIPTTVLTYASHNPDLAPRWDPIYAIYEKIQLTGFFLQETIISGLYLWHTRRILKEGVYINRADTRGVMRHLIQVNIIIILLDLVLVSTEYANLYQIQTLFKPAVYSIKLDLEFSILNQLRGALTSARATTIRQPSGNVTVQENYIKMQDLKPSDAESNLSTNDLFDREGNPKGNVKEGIVKTTEINIDRSGSQPRQSQVMWGEGEG